MVLARPGVSVSFVISRTMWILFSAFVVLAVWLTNYNDARKTDPRSLLSLPGPSPLPIIGNIFDMPASYGWITYAEWEKRHGNVLALHSVARRRLDSRLLLCFHRRDCPRKHLLGKNLIVLNTSEVANEIVEKRSAKYSDRPRKSW